MPMMYPNPGMRDANDRRDDLKTVERKGTRERPRLETVEKNMEQLLSVDEVAGVLGTSDRFPRRLIAERRIRFVRVGRHVRIPVSALEEFVREGTVDPIVITWRSGQVA